ncbi:E3 ubiquitin-protein ligase RNF220 isoform X5 [Sagmatias obliquidens]|uniref:E3 ubiquitin-protein ligase RNF220 isoform X5 n=1 Tax=Sagmatias obliquidens TaxID=3371155 RepID=UPI000F4454C2|nr:E3 ubiquitin-protein ligase RNF220 isoform X5 [Lagenorhynchus obliquidens]XP_026964560.1 E3 ubiquitin-protein ligase RNF220 isoform X5 [Lagenorhynchus obliquidens]XP_030721810.1 E3 ubiquitin-protein ligase RNF220 isoform X5 [Globicephala melas]XP_030721817.1 E3 ubiquitin-protein ligase RNF220 isoform X5 [Globicephala melas]
MKGRGKAPAWLRMMPWTSSMRTATASRSMSGAGRSGYGPPLSWKVVSEALASSCAAAKRIRTVMLTWMWMGMTLWSMGNHSILGALRDKGQCLSLGRGSPPEDSTLMAHRKLGSIVLDHRARYTEADVIPCTGEEPGEAKEREALRGAVLNGGPPSTRITPEFSKWASDEMPSTSNGESSKQEAMQKTCKNSDIEKITEDSAVTTFEALKARVRELERQLSRGDRYKCLICMDSYSMPLTSIQCWHVHCEECWLRTLGAKKLCPQCNTITAPGDLRRIYL